MAAGALLLLASALAAESGAESERLDEAACRALGFGPSLLCSTCAQLGEFVGADDALIGECESCCSAESDGSRTYASAVFDVCK